MLTFRDLIHPTISSSSPLEEICRLKSSGIFNSFKVNAFEDMSFLFKLYLQNYH